MRIIYSLIFYKVEKPKSLLAKTISLTKDRSWERVTFDLELGHKDDRRCEKVLFYDVQRLYRYPRKE